MSNRVETKTVASCKWLRNTGMGNSVWVFTFVDGSKATTSANTQFSVGVVDDGRMDGKTYDVYMTASGRIIDMTPVSKYAVDPSVEYVCHYQAEDGSVRRAIYNVFGSGKVHAAMAMHNSAMPEYATSVIKWISPEGVVVDMHDSKVTL